MPERTHVAAVAVLTVLLAGCAGIPAPAPSPQPTATSAPVFAVVAGDCLGAFDFGNAPTARQIVAAPCDVPHAWQVTAAYPLTDLEYPGAEAVKTEAASQCAKAFKKFIGADVAYSRYTSAYLAPDGNAWGNRADREIVCLAGDPDGGLQASVKGDSSIFPHVGQCTGPQDVAPTDVRIVSCAKKHNYEVYAEQKITMKAAPTDEEINKLVDDVCVAGFESFVGVTSAKSEYEYTWFVAGSDLWAKVADHRIVCSAGLAAGGVIGTLKGKNA